jgi:hypothetical protein
MKYTLYILGLLSILSSLALAEDGYYYSDNRQISLTPIPDKIVIGFADPGCRFEIQFNH